jgi:hypothetical protein
MCLRPLSPHATRAPVPPVVFLNRAVAVGMAYGPAARLELVDELTTEPALKSYHLLPSVRGDLLLKLLRFGEARIESNAQRRLRRTPVFAPCCSNGPLCAAEAPALGKQRTTNSAPTRHAPRHAAPFGSRNENYLTVVCTRFNIGVRIGCSSQRIAAPNDDIQLPRGGKGHEFR